MIALRGKRCRWVFSFLLFLMLVAVSGRTAAAGADSCQVWQGVFHRWWVDPAGPWAIHVLEVDLTANSVDVITTKAGDRLAAREKTSEMARRWGRTGSRVIGAVNGDFFTADGIPIGLQVIRGVPLKEPSYRTVFGITRSGKPFLSPLAMNAWVAGRSGWKRKIARINRGPLPGELVLYNGYGGPEVELKDGVAALCLLLDSLQVQQKVRVVCTQVDSARSHWKINGRHVLLAGRGNVGRDLARACAPGDTLAVRIDLWPEQESPIAEAIGGLPRIVRHGRISIEVEREGASERFRDSRHPRTAVGITRDGRKLLLVTVDGRQPGYSVGMTLTELASLMLRLGAYEALNLDGGGSTTMVVSDSVVNRPSDATGERPVSNAILVVSRSQGAMQNGASGPCGGIGWRERVPLSVPAKSNASP